MIDYNKYKNREIKKVDEERLSKIEEIPFHKDMYYKNINRMLASPTIAELIGYKKYEDGSGVASAYTRMDGITKEMIHWWNVWVMFDPKRYHIWLPEIHLNAGKPTDKDKANLLDKKTPLHQRRWGTISRMKHSSGLPKFLEAILSKLGMKFGGVIEHHKRPIEIGIDESIFEDEDMRKFVCSVKYISRADYPIVTLHYLVEDEKGVDVHTRMWHGVQFNGKRFERVGKKIPMKQLKKSLGLCLEEMTSLSGILKELYEIEEGKIK